MIRVNYAEQQDINCQERSLFSKDLEQKRVKPSYRTKKQKVTDTHAKILDARDQQQVVY